jgi:hypothetical protein
MLGTERARLHDQMQSDQDRLQPGCGHCCEHLSHDSVICGARRAYTARKVISTAAALGTKTTAIVTVTAFAPAMTA